MADFVRTLCLHLIQLLNFQPEPRLSAKFMEMLDRDSVSDVLFDHASPATMYRVGRTCWMAWRAVQDYSRRTFNINSRLRRFFDDPIGFRNLQAQTGTVISGAFAHRFFDRTLGDESHLDLYVYPHHAVDVGRWVMNDCGKSYRFKPVRRQHQDFDVAVVRRHIISSWTLDSSWEGGEDWDIYQGSILGGAQNLLKFVASNEELSLTVRIIVTNSSPFQTLLAHQWHSTAFMNVITFRAAYSSHPFATFEERKCLIASNRRERLCMVDRQLGCDVIDTLQGMEQIGSFMEEERHLNDALSWVLLLDMRDISWPELSPNILKFDPLIVNSWNFHTLGLRMRVSYWEIIEEEIFKFQYCFARFDENQWLKINALLNAVRLWAWMFPCLPHTWYDEVIFGYKIWSLESRSLTSQLLDIFWGSVKTHRTCTSS